LIFTASDDTTSIQKKLTLLFKSKPALTKVSSQTQEFAKPTVFIHNVSKAGLVDLRFNQNMLFEDKYTELLNSEGKEVGFEVTYSSGYGLDDNE
jgi:hypothetical protein